MLFDAALLSKNKIQISEYVHGNYWNFGTNQKSKSKRISILIFLLFQAAFVNNPLLGIFFLAAFFLLDWQVR
jgi:hypothetical protein